MASDYPRWVYASDGRAQVVNNEDEEAALGNEFSRNPSDVHRGVAGGVPDMPLPHGQEALINAIADAVAQRVIDRLTETRPVPEAPRERSRR